MESRKIYEILEIAISKHLSPDLAQNAEIMVQIGRGIVEDITAILKIRMPAQIVFESKIESSVWQTLKKRWFPRFLLKKFPVKYDQTRVYFLHPEIKTKPESGLLYQAVKQFNKE